MPQPILFLISGPARNIQANGRRGTPPNLCGAFPLPALQPIRISGVTKDSTGAALGGCIVQLFRTLDDTFVEETTSDGSGNYTFNMVGLGQMYYAVAYKAGSPDVAGTTANTIAGA